MKKTEIQKLYRELYREIEEILFRCDPIGINFDENIDEYDPEVGTILPRLKGTRSEADVLNIIYEEFMRWSGVDIARKATRKEIKQYREENK